MGQALEVAKVLVQPTMKLLEMCGSAIGAVYEPRYIRKKADAEAYRIKQLAEAVGEASGLPVTYDNGSISMSTVDFDDLAKRADFRAKYQSLREQNNIDNVVINAYKELEGAPKIPDDPINEDWTTRFFNIVKEINTEEMQHIWSKILAGEITKPGSFSMRTLETIRNISQTEAKTFQKVVPLIVIAGNDFLLTSDKDIYEKFGINFSDILMLDECGLMTSSGMLSLTQTITGKSDVLVYNSAFVMVANDTTEKTAKIDYMVYPLTSAGKELYRILSCTPNKEYFLAFAEHIFKENRGVKLKIYNVISVDDSAIHYEDTIVREFYEKKGTIE